MGRVQEAHVRSIEISKKGELSIQLGPGRSFIGPSLGLMTLTPALAEALAASELLANARDTPLPRPRSHSLSSPTSPHMSRRCRLSRARLPSPRRPGSVNHLLYP